MTMMRKSLLLLLCLWGATGFSQAPPNDLCANAIDLVCGTPTNGTVTNATPTQGYQLLNDVWYRVSNVSGPVTVSMCGTAIPFDSWIRVYKPEYVAACQPGMTLVASNDDFCGALSQVSWTAASNEVYYIQVRDWGPTTNGQGQLIIPYGPFTITATCTPTTPPNDACTNATTVSCGQTIAGTTVGATPELGFSSPGVWYMVVGTGNPIEASLCGLSSYDNAISVYTNTCQNPVLVTSDDNSCGGTSAKVTFNTVQGVFYRILVNGTGTASGIFQLAINCPNPAPSNDLCINPITVLCNSVTPGTTTGATGAFQNGPDVWYRFIGTGTLVTASLCGSGNFDSYMMVQQLAGGDCSTAITSAWTNDNACGQDAEVTFMAQLGVTYLIRVAGYAWNNFGNFTLTLSCDTDVVPNNDSCTNAKPVRCGGDYLGTTLNSTPDNIYSGPVMLGTTNGVWYSFVGSGGTVTISLCGSNQYDNYLHLFKGGCTEGAMERVAFDDDGCNVNCRWSLSAIIQNFQTQVGVTYYILVGGYGNATGNFTLTISGSDCVSKPGKDCDIKEKNGSAPLNKLNSGLEVTVAPNPSVEQVDFNLAVNVAGAAKLRIVSLTGQVILDRELGLLEVGTHNIRHDWQGIAAGIYIYEVSVGEAKTVGKLQVQR